MKCVSGASWGNAGWIKRWSGSLGVEIGVIKTLRYLESEEKKWLRVRKRTVGFNSERKKREK